MRRQFVKDRALLTERERRYTVAAATIEEVRELCPWSAAIEEVEGGWMAFEDLNEYEVWTNQNN